VKHVEHIASGSGQPAQAVQSHRAEGDRVHAAKIEHESAVDEHPHVVVAPEVEALAAVVHEGQMDLRREEEVA